MNMSIFWIIAIVAMLVLELSTTTLVSIWFVGGAIAALILALLHFPIAFQAAAFFFVSAALLITCRGWLEKHFHPVNEPDALGRLKNVVGTVTTEIEPVKGGRVLVNGQDWKAISANNQPIAQGDLVRIREIRGVKLVVSMIDQPPKLP